MQLVTGRPVKFRRPATLCTHTDCLAHRGTLVTSLGGNVGGPKAIKTLVSGYQGQAAICVLMGAWLTDLLADGGGAGAGKTTKSSLVAAKDLIPGTKDPKALAADAMRSIAESVVRGVATDKFTKAG